MAAAAAENGGAGGSGDVRSCVQALCVRGWEAERGTRRIGEIYSGCGEFDAGGKVTDGE